MSGAYEIYAREISKLNFLATWPPNTRMNLGDIGRLDGGMFVYRDNLKNRGIEWKRRPGKQRAAIQHATSNSVEIKQTFDAQATGFSGGSGTSEIEINFKRESAVYFRAQGCIVHQIDDQDTLSAEILDRARKKIWNASDVVVTEVIESLDTTILISGGRGATCNLVLGVDTNFSSPAIHGRTRLVRASDVSTQFIGEAMTPLFRVRRVRRGLFGADFQFSPGGVDPIKEVGPGEWPELAYQVK